MEKHTRQTHRPTVSDSKRRVRFPRLKKREASQNGELPWIAVNSNGMILLNPPKFFRNIALFCNRHKLATKVVSVLLVILLLSTIFIESFGEFFKNMQYKITPKAEALLSTSAIDYGSSLQYDAQNKVYDYNKDYKPTSGGVGGQVAGPKFTAVFHEDPKQGMTITDPQYQVSFTMKPKYRLLSPRQEKNRLLYAIPNGEAVKVITLGVAGMKEDIILENFQKNEMEFEYELVLPDTLEARLESNGSVAIYGPGNTALLGNVATGTEEDAKLLETARKNDKKTSLIFTIPAPYIKESGKKIPNYNVKFELSGTSLKIKAFDLQNATYPLSIDPSVYIETASKLMRGNNETNTDFDIDNELIQKSQTTGARIDAWEDNLDFNNGTWDHSIAAAGGYLYRTGGRTDPSRPSVVSTTETLAGTDSSPFSLNMPAERPAGDLYIAVMCHDGSDGGLDTPPSGWTQITDAQGFIAYYKVGTDQGGGNESASYSWTGYGNEEWAGAIIRITNFNSSDPIAGTPGTGSNASAVTPVFPATTPDADSTLVVRAVGFDQDNPSTTGWVPSGHTRLGSSSSSGGGNGSCGYAATTQDTPPASGVSTGTATFADASVSDDYGGMSIAINPVSVTPGVQATVQWAKFNSSTLAIESPNPGTGACSGWCSNSAYNLPEARRGHASVAYNGYLYVIGGTDGTNRESTVFIAKIGANGEPQLWHPSGGTPAYWYTDTGLNGATARSYLTAVAYNNRMYVLGGQTNASSGGVTTVEYADINPNGTLSTWSTGSALPSARHGHTTHIYNDVMYLIGGNSSGTLQNSVHYVKLNSNGSMNTWTATASFTTARSSMGGSFTAIWGAYIYLTGGCTAVNGSGYCTTIASDTQIGSLNADGTISEWGSISNLTNQRMGFNIIGWQNGLYRLGGCTQQNTSTGVCINALADVDYGTVNSAGEVSTVSISVPSGTAPCSGAGAYDCDLPPPGDDAGEGGQMLSMSTINNGYLYVIGGCIDYDCNGSTPAGDDNDVTGNISYASINSNGRLTAPGSCSGTSYGAWCVDSTNRINGTTGIAAGGITVFNDRVYVVGGLTGAGISTNIYYNSFSNNGSLAGAWSSVDMTTAGIAEDIAYTYAFSRANPVSAGSNPGNLYVIGGCGNNGGGAGCGASDYETEVYKCNITTAGSVSGCTTTGQLQIDVELADETDQGLGIHSGTTYANYVYLIGGYSPNVPDRDTVFYAKIDNSNNIVDAVSGLASGNDEDWIESSNTLSVGRRRGWAFGYNGHIYSVGGYDDSGTGIIPFIEWSKMNVSDGSIDQFVTSSVTINQRWGLTMVVSNSYAYVIGGCDNGASPGSCTSFENSIQTFQLYNNDSGALNNFTAQSDDTFTADTDRWGASSAIYNGYLYVAGGCISTTDCTNATNSVQYAPISASDGTIGTWAAGGNLPADRAWGSLEVAGGTLYYIGGQDDTATNEYDTVYYTSSISSGNPTWNGTAASNGLPGARTRFSSAVWNDRLYVVGGLDGSAAVSATVYVSPQLTSGGNITSAWTSSTAFNIARTGAAVTAYANNLYLFGGFDGTNYLSDVQYAQINSDGSVDSWLYTTSLPGPIRDAKAVSANGYIYLIGGRSAATTCAPNVLITPISANTTIATGNNPTGTGEWYETNVRYAGGRYGMAIAYDKGKLYAMGGGCNYPSGPAYSTGTIGQATTTVTGTGTNWTNDLVGGTITYQDASTATILSVNSTTSLTVSVSKTVTAPQTYSISLARHTYGTVKSQPQVAIYSRMIDTDTDVFPNSWLMNGVDNSIGARWQVKYRSMHDTSDGTGQQNPNEDCGTSATMPLMTTWGQETNHGDTTLGQVESYTPLNSSGGDINCARYYYFYISIDASKTFGYPEDVTRGPTIADLSLFFTSDPSKRLRHGKTFTGGEQQPLDTPCRVSIEQPNCPEPAL